MLRGNAPGKTDSPSPDPPDPAFAGSSSESGASRGPAPGLSERAEASRVYQVRTFTDLREGFKPNRASEKIGKGKRRPKKTAPRGMLLRPRGAVLL